MTIGAVLDEAWTLYTRFFGRFFLLGLVVFAIVNLAYALLVEAISNDSAGAAATLGIIGVATAIVGTTWLQGAFVYAVQDARDGSFDSTLHDVFVRVSPESSRSSSRVSWRVSASRSGSCSSSCRGCSFSPSGP